MDSNRVTATDLFADQSDDGALLRDASPRFERRITDKVLAAFAHAYALDEMELASKLWTALELADRIGDPEPEPVPAADRRGMPHSALEYASYWVRLVDSRRHYQDSLSRAPAADDPKLETARAEVADAYNKWRAQFETE